MVASQSSVMLFKPYHFNRDEQMDQLEKEPIPFSDAKELLLKKAKGRYCMIRYALVTQPDGTEVSECGLYIDGYHIYEGRTWDNAFEKLNLALHPITMKPSKIEAPN